jgi:hypothetical protein
MHPTVKTARLVGAAPHARQISPAVIISLVTDASWLAIAIVTTGLWLFVKGVNVQQWNEQASLAR